MVDMHRRVYNERVSAQLPADMTLNSPECAAHRGPGRIEEKVITLTGGAGAKTYDVFDFTGSVVIKGLWAIFETCTDTTTVSLASFQWHDGTGPHDLTADVDCSGAGVNSLMAKTQTLANAAEFTNSTTGGVLEVAASNKSLQVFFLTALEGAANKIKFHCTQDGDTAATVRVYCEWVCRNQLGSTVTAV